MSREALIIVDVQNDFCPGGALPVPGGDRIIKLLNKLILQAREKRWEIVASRDWHPAKTTHFDKWPVHCVEETEGAAFHPGLDLEGVKIFSKGMGEEEDAYSAFDGRDDEGIKLEDFLRKMGVNRLFIGGLATDYCVKASVLDGVKNNFSTFWVEDASRGVNLKPGDETAALDEMLEAGVEAIWSWEVISGDY